MFRFRNLRVRTLIGIAVGGLGLLLIQSGASDLFKAVKQQAVGRMLESRVTASTSLFSTLLTLRLETGAVKTALANANPMDASAKSDLLTYRKRIDESARAAIAGLGSADDPALTALQNTIRAQYQAVLDGRAAVDAALSEPLPRRSASVLTEAPQALTRFMATVTEANNEIAMQLQKRDPIVDEWLLVASAAWRARVNVGPAAARVQMALAAGETLPPAQQLGYAQDMARAEGAWAFVKDVAARPDASPRLLAQMAKADLNFAGPFAESRKAIVAALAAGETPAVSLNAVRREDTQTNGYLVDIVETALSEMNSRAEAIIVQRFNDVSRAGVELLLALILTAAGFAITWLRFSRPMEQILIAVERLMAGDYEQTIPCLDRGDEMGRIAHALQNFQEHGGRVRAMEAQEREAAQRRLQAAESMASVVSDVGEVVAAAAAGDFTARLQIEHADEQMQKLVAGINEINAVVDSATTEFAHSLRAVAEGDLTQRIDTPYRGRFAEFKGAVNDTVDRLSQTVRTIQLTASDVGLAAREINIGADDLSKRTEEQASSLEETAATTEELAASVKASAQASREAAAIADDARQAAQAGGAIADQAVQAMARIETASQKISDIIRVIDDIAFQTNLLALNAAVEAARAGDAGKGFAVVASEVRTLAQRSGEAAKDISALISSSNMEVGEGVKLVRQAGESLERILDASQKVAATIADISSASGEQANGIDEMSQAVAHLDEMTQQNAALAEESAASAGSLSGKIGQLNDLVAAFRTGPDAAALQAPAPLRAPAPRQPGSEPERLRALAETAFTPARAAVKKAAKAPVAEVVKKVVNSHGGDSGWSQF